MCGLKWYASSCVIYIAIVVQKAVHGWCRASYNDIEFGGLNTTHISVVGHCSDDEVNLTKISATSLKDNAVLS